MTGYVVVLDGNVLYGIEVTDSFASMATHRLFRPHWSPQIFDEVERNLSLRPDLDPAAIRRRLDLLNQALPGALSTLPDSLIEAMSLSHRRPTESASAPTCDAGWISTRAHPPADCVLQWMARGETNARIPRRLSITEGTVKSHVQSILRKLGAANRAEAAAFWSQIERGTGQR
ncbi:LuxR C-terminal-related transcriptional regulator [Sporichthya sp.]|uniref:LuxR C-terminal-related transcriptional regulator n=1 Tax=Sporichthya sp. TaxID=65475 RepID=UPI0025DA1CC8|nr:LuxR C-terminal-related transcriptional regulator [Sporichthya sp.]